MKFTAKFLKILVVFTLSIFLLPAVTQAQQYTQKNLVSDLPQPNNADGTKVLVDPNLKNPWGLTRSSTNPARPGSPWWVGNNNSGTSTLYDGNGNPINIFTEAGGIAGNFVIVPPPGFAPGTQSTPTGVVVNGSANGAVYKGMTSADVNGKRFLYVTNFRSARVEVYDTTFKRVRLDEDAFEAEGVPRGFAPFNVQNIGGTLFVTYAKQDAPRHDPVGGAGLGFVEIFTPSGKHIGHLERGDWFNAPWGVVWTTRDFGEFSNAILVGNFRSGWIAAFNGFTHKFIGFVRNPDNSLMFIDGLWSLTFGNDATAGPANTLFFTAGINNETDGLFGTITPFNGLDGDEE